MQFNAFSLVIIVLVACSLTTSVESDFLGGIGNIVGGGGIIGGSNKTENAPESNATTTGGADGIVGSIVNGVANATEDAVGDITETVGGVAESIGNAVVSVCKSIGVDHCKRLYAFINNAIDFIKSVVAKIVQFLNNMVEYLLAPIKGIIAKVKSEL